MDQTDLQPTSNPGICTQCALCCNGVLFADVRLLPSDRVTALSSCGVKVRRRPGSQARFRQPCACLDGNVCRIYASRPNHCRTFECRLLERLTAGVCSLSNALASIRSLQRRVQRVNRLLLESGQTDLTQPLASRYSRVMRLPMDLEQDPMGAERRGRLMIEMHRLMTAVQKDFLGGGAAPS